MVTDTKQVFTIRSNVTGFPLAYTAVGKSWGPGVSSTAVYPIVLPTGCRSGGCFLTVSSSARYSGGSVGSSPGRGFKSS